MPIENDQSASRYFYCAKASAKDRDEGLDGFSEQQVKGLEGGKLQSEISDDKFTTVKRNIHPTVKPCELMAYLVRLVTPKNGIVLDPFMGSGSTGKAIMFENRERKANYKFIGIEKDKKYYEIAEARIKFAKTLEYEMYDEKTGEKLPTIKKINLFDI